LPKERNEMEPVPTDTGKAATSTGEVIKERVRQMYSRSAEAYVTSPSHATGEDLAELLILAAPQPGDRALDISTGGGHTALAIAPHVYRTCHLTIAGDELIA
jgi:ubiquinone/menaquinone biosynthesis C-methylase UbiE